MENSSDRFLIDEYDDIDRLNSIAKQCQLTPKFIREHADSLNWDVISKYQKLNEEFISEFSNLVNWDLIAKYQTLSSDFIKKNSEKFCVDIIILNQKITFNLLKEFREEIGIKDKVSFKFFLDCIVRKCKLPKRFIEKHLKEFDINLLIENQKLSSKLIEKIIKDFQHNRIYTRNLNLNNLVKHQKVSSKFLPFIVEKSRETIDWKLITRKCELSDDMIIQFSDYLDLEWLFLHKKLSPFVYKFIEIKLFFRFYLNKKGKCTYSFDNRVLKNFNELCASFA